MRGSVTNIVDSSDDVVKSYDYEAYGKTEGTGTFVNSFAYTGAVNDEETGLYYLNARYYDPDTGRFISQDSYRGGGEAFWNLYLYCDSDPVNCVDPTGHSFMSTIYKHNKWDRLIKKWLIFRPGIYTYNYRINYVFACRLAHLAKDKGRVIRIGSGYRSHTLQKQAYYHGESAIYKNGVFVRNPKAAKPGTSWHEYRLAVDVKWTWLANIDADAATNKQYTLKKYGLYKPFTKGNGTPKDSRENWHIQPIETRYCSTKASKMRSFAAVANYLAGINYTYRRS